MKESVKIVRSHARLPFTKFCRDKAANGAFKGFPAAYARRK